MARKKAKTKKVKPAEDSTLKELALAYGRVNGVPARRLKWLLAFSELDLDNLSEGHLANLRWELVVFGLNKKPDQMKSRSDIFHDLIALTVDLSPQGSLDTREEIEAYNRNQEVEMKKGAPLTLLKYFQTTMRKAFDDLYKPGWWQVTRPTTTERIALDMKDSEGHERAQNPPVLSGHDILLMQAIDLIKAERQRLKVCQNPKCKKRFVAAKKGRAFFHSPQCSAYVRVNKKRGKL